MARLAEGVDPDTLDVWTDPANERLNTSATIITFVRTIASVTLSGFAIEHHSLKLLVIALAVYWAGDSLDGFVARIRGCETRIGAVLDIMSDRFCAAGFYFGLAWIHHQYAAPVLLYLFEFMVVDCFLSIAFLAWNVRSPNYFYVIDRTIYNWNWSKPAKAVNSSLFAVLLLVTKMPWLGIVIASALIVMKIVSLARLLRLGLPVPTNREPLGSVAESPAA
ncbi:MAG: alcohol phosphatidyltransferase [Marmoricola sp.]|jgi:CDP-diacylglycerol--glycerol-3-phosphate 3-phosphatidyltransferase|nr:alcohol phosphatidyltransferase [Marmoricola sp.]